jgi:hypothetical protein
MYIDSLPDFITIERREDIYLLDMVVLENIDAILVAVVMLVDNIIIEY